MVHPLKAVHIWLLLVSVGLCESRVYQLQDTYKGNDFYRGFTWQNFDDPTHGTVNYVDKFTSVENNLTFADDNSFIMRADYSNIVPPNARGRDSVRISSDTSYNEGLFILDLTHLPTGCGTWPAFWSLGSNVAWPTNGEIDIIEGVNDHGSNLMSLHTLPNCTMPPSSSTRIMSGNPTSSDCNTAVNYNTGCGVSSTQPSSFGPSFNAAGGGWYALQRTEGRIAIWFWSRRDPNAPKAITQGLAVVDERELGIPDALFVSEDCDFATHFGPHSFVFDLTFCGDWAGTAYGSSGCPGSCDHYVRNTPSAYTEAYWDINAFRTYLDSSASDHV